MKARGSDPMGEDYTHMRRMATCDLCGKELDPLGYGSPTPNDEAFSAGREAAMRQQNVPPVYWDDVKRVPAADFVSADPLGYFVLVKGPHQDEAPWEADWDGQLYFELEAAEQSQREAQAAGYDAVVCALYLKIGSEENQLRIPKRAAGDEGITPPYGEEPAWQEDGLPAPSKCADCGVPLGDQHWEACEVAWCLACNRQRFVCMHGFEGRTRSSTNPSL